MLNAKITERNFAVVLKSAQTIEPRLLAVGARGLARGLQGAISVIQLQFLDGPRPGKLGIKTGRLIKSIVSEVSPSERGVVGRVGTNVVYAPFHEFGFHGAQEVRAHTRAIGGRA